MALADRKTTLKGAYLRQLSKLVISDLAGARPCTRPKKFGIDRIASYVIQRATELRVVYTAFDGDHQMFCSLMRERVLRDGKVPANPDSILGYKETLSHRQTKRGVLLDDLSVLRGCDELWIFTDLPPLANSVDFLAEGVLVELLYFLKRHPNRPVKVLNLGALAAGALDTPGERWPLNYAETSRCLSDDQRSEILGLANSGLDTDRDLRDICYYLHDPLDYKYSRFVREGGYGEDEVPLLPYLAVRIEDFPMDGTGPARVVIQWARLMSLASSCTKLPPLDPSRESSQIVDLLERVWLRKPAPTKPKKGDWTRFKVPKASQKGAWAITAKERRNFGKS